MDCGQRFSLLLGRSKAEPIRSQDLACIGIKKKSTRSGQFPLLRSCPSVLKDASEAERIGQERDRYDSEIEG